MKKLSKFILDNILHILIVILLFLSGFLIIYPRVYNINKIELKLDSIKNIDTLTKYEVYKEILNQDIKYPDIVMSQALFESAHLTSYNCINRNNLFGFRGYKFINDNNPYGYIIFNSWKESVGFYKNWQDLYYHNGDYYNFLNKIGYSEDSTYCNKLKQIKYWIK